ncbi:RNA-directed DNA polymerase from mobile element jockey [Nephila pilipes]|uniref:RNA-directed DNA polymerase from mobile element jockey n=1 Tax=Nephila pilipes TaxID=299642 RepID=A0A8X6U886_NEPPI|nr:RNA-directed DNA polymerase from mobile element jockey [Nephila pilipes]
MRIAHHIRKAHQKAIGMSRLLTRLISRKSKLAIRHKILLYKSILRPITMNASPIWASAATTHLKRLHVFQNIHLRKMINAPWFVRNEVLHKDLNIEPILEFIKKQSFNFFNRIPQIPNALLQQLPAYDASIASSQKIPRAALGHSYIHFPVLKRLRAH